MDIAGYHIPGLAAAAAAFAAMYGAFAGFDKDQSPENRKFIRDWLIGLKVNDENWNHFFDELFSRLFGSEHFSLKCVMRSFMLSSGLIIALFLLLLGKEIFILDGVELTIILGMTLGCGCVADYLSLWKTRLLLTGISSLRNGVAVLAIVIGDFVATTFIFFSMWLIGITLFEFAASELSMRRITLVLLAAIADMVHQTKSTVLLLYAVALLTSAWLWIYLIVAYVMRGLNQLPRWLKPLSKVMDFENHPVRTIGYVAATVSAVIVGVISII